MKYRFTIVALLLTFLLVPAFGNAGTRLKDLASVEGVREYQLIGYGLVVGLNGTRNKRQTIFPSQTLTNMLQRIGIAVNPTINLDRNTAAVMVTASLPPFAQTGPNIDGTLPAIGDTTNQQDGL